MKAGRPQQIERGEGPVSKIFRMSPEQAAWVEAEAQRQGESEAAVIRRLIRKEMEV